MKPILLLSTAIIALTAGQAMAGWGYPPILIGPRVVTDHAQVPASHLLYNQNSNFGYGIVSTNFTCGSFDTAYSSAAADDFAIPAGRTWTITRVDVTGLYFNGSGGMEGPATSEIVNFYSDHKGQPGKLRASYTLNCDGETGKGSFACKIPGPHGRGLRLFGGTAGKRYWLSVVANMDFVTGVGEWGWTENTKIQHNPALWENPGNGFGTGCTTWNTNEACVGLPGDYAFDLRGSKS